MTLRFLVATVQGHGIRDNDFMWATEGEPAYLVPAADGRQHRDPDHKCACSRAFIGVHTAKTTSTVRVADVDMSRDELIDAMTAGQSWYSRADVADIVDELRVVVQHWPIGTIVERRGRETIRERMNPEEAASWRSEHEQATLAKIERDLAEAEARTAERRAQYESSQAARTEGAKDGEGQ